MGIYLNPGNENFREILSGDIYVDKTPENALNQIRQKRYFASLSHYAGNLLFVGINYDEHAKTHTCKIEKFVKEQ